MSKFDMYLEKIQKIKNNDHVYNESVFLGVVGELFALVAILGVISLSALSVFKAFLDHRRENKNIKKAAIEILNKYKKPNDKIPAIINPNGTLNKQVIDSLSLQDKRVIYRDITEAMRIVGEESGIDEKEKQNIIKTDSRLGEEGSKEFWAKRKKLGEDMARRNREIPKEDDIFK